MLFGCNLNQEHTSRPMNRVVLEHVLVIETFSFRYWDSFLSSAINLIPVS